MVAALRGGRLHGGFGAIEQAVALTFLYMLQ
jgi:hypothetical protein